MRKYLVLIQFGVIVTLASLAKADTVTLKDGKIIRGTIVAEDADAVSIKHKNESGTITITDKVARRDIASVAKGDTPEPAPAAAKAPASQPAAAKADPDDLKPEIIPESEKPKFLSRTIDYYQKKKYRMAGIGFTKLIQSCANDEELKKWSDKAQEAAQKPLADLAADSHLQAALETARGAAIQLQHITPYEAEALVKQLETIYQEAMTKPAEVSGPKPPANAKAGAPPKKPQGKNGGPKREEEPPKPATSLVINEWIGKPGEFDGKPPEAKAFLKHIAHTLSVLDAMTRYDAKVKSDAATKDKYAADRKKLIDLRAAVTKRMGGALTAAEKQKLEEEQKKYEEKMVEEQQKYERWIMLRNQARDRD